MSNEPMGLAFPPVFERPTIPAVGGKEYYVDATNGSDDNDGSNPEQALATIQAAIDKCVSGKGDVVYIFPGSYVENLSIVGKDYVHLIGAQAPGYARPDVVPDTGVALNCDTSQGLVCKRMRFYSADSDVVQLEGNGFLFEDCVFDGDTGMAATEALLRLRGNDSDDSYTASEGVVRDCLFRGSNGYGLALDTGNAPDNGVGVTHCVFDRCRFVSNAGIDIVGLDTGLGGVHTVQDCLFSSCWIGMGSSKNKATHIDIKTKGGASNTGNVFAGCYINDDTIDTTAIKSDGTGSSFIGCFNLDGVIDGDAID